MFEIFKSKKVGELSDKVNALEQGLSRIKETCGLGVEVVGLQEQIILNLQEQLSTTQSRLVKAEKTNVSLSRKLKRAEKQPTYTILPKEVDAKSTGDLVISNEKGCMHISSGGTININKVKPKSRAEKIKLAVDRVQPAPKKHKIVGELTPRSVKMGELSVTDRAATISDILGVDVDTNGKKGNSLIIKKTKEPVRVMYEKDGKYMIKSFTKDGYVLFPDPITNKFLLTYLRVGQATKSGIYSFYSDDARASAIRSNHNKVLSVLKDKVGV